MIIHKRPLLSWIDQDCFWHLFIKGWRARYQLRQRSSEGGGVEDQDEAALRALGIDPADVANAEASRSIKTGDLKRPFHRTLKDIFAITTSISTSLLFWNLQTSGYKEGNIFNISSTLSIAGKWSRTSTIAIIPIYSYYFLSIKPNSGSQIFRPFFQSWLIILKVFWINNHIEFPLLNWMNIFWMNILDFVLNWIIFRPDSMKKWTFKKDRPPLNPAQ